MSNNESLQVGNWVYDGKTLNFIGKPFYCEEYPYVIEKSQLKEGPNGAITWRQHLKEKIWFTPECESDFIRVVVIIGKWEVEACF